MGAVPQVYGFVKIRQTAQLNITVTDRPLEECESKVSANCSSPEAHSELVPEGRGHLKGLQLDVS